MIYKYKIDVRLYNARMSRFDANCIEDIIERCIRISGKGVDNVTFINDDDTLDEMEEDT